MILEGEIKDAKNEQFFVWFPNTHLTLISFVFSSWIIDVFKRVEVNTPLESQCGASHIGFPVGITAIADRRHDSEGSFHLSELTG